MGAELPETVETAPDAPPADATLRELQLYHQLETKDEHIRALSEQLEALSRYLYDNNARKFPLDPAISSLVNALSAEVKRKDEQITSLKAELSAMTFSSDSYTGKRLVERLRALQEENEELGRQLHQGRVEQYQVEISLQRRLNSELTAALEDSKKLAASLDAELHHQVDTITELNAKLQAKQAS